jgi:hypothetical protein
MAIKASIGCGPSPGGPHNASVFLVSAAMKPQSQRRN